ncbi:MAG: AAA family ATPase [Candidatus Paceibacterota bacterium]
MYLKGLEISGFKSFAKKSNLEFTTPISAIVGPNGSGKSNIAEAFRFVLGEQSIKSLRGKKGEDLIFNGSTEVGRSNRASVKVVFDNARRFLNIDFDEVSIERVVHRDGVNEYFINGSQVRLKDIIELLAGAHIGSSGHHIISQGEADKILNANLRERRSMIEDALGLKIYQYKRQESERKLEKTEENIKSVESLRKEVAPHLRFLKKQVEKVEKTMQMKEELKTLYLEYFKREDDYIKRAKEQNEKERAPLQSELEALEADLARAKKTLEDSTGKDKKSLEVIGIEENIRKVRNAKDALFRDLGRIEGEISSEERIIKKQKEIAHSEEGKMVSLKDVEGFANEVVKNVESAETLNDLNQIKKLFQNIKEIVVSFISKNRTQVNDSLVKESEEHIASLRAQKKDLEKQASDFEKEEKDLQDKYSLLRAEIEKEKDTNREAERQMFALMNKQNEIISKMNIIKGSLEKLRLEEDDFRRELGEAGVLIGRAVLDFSSFTLPPVSIDMYGKDEPRSAQEDRRRAIEKIKIRIEDAGGGSSDEIMKEYREVSERDTFLERELEDLQKSAISLKALIVELDEKLTTEFKNGVEKINVQFQEFFSLMFGGGNAELVVVKEKKKKRAENDADIFSVLEMDENQIPEEEDGEEGLDISVSLPRKKIKGLVMLSGGERALTSIALLFAVSQVNPPPFIILDETDAALDEANSKKYGDMIENLSKYSQLILITHNRETMSRAGILYGVTMTSGGVSKLLSIEFEEAVAVAK